MIGIKDLPMGTNPKPVNLPHFPTRYQAFIWRNWGLVPADKIAAILSCPTEKVIRSAEQMGLDPKCPVDAKWNTNGYLTLLRHNWHLLDYEQILQMLEWSADKLSQTLREEDCCYGKLGGLKPACEKLLYRELSAEETEATAKLREILRQYFPFGKMDYLERPFAFADVYRPHPVFGKDRFSFNYLHSYAASCGDIFLNADLLDPVPENLMDQYASMGVKGIWMQFVLYLLEPIPGAEEFSAGHEKRLENLKRIVATCKKYGMKLYLYFNEPRTLPNAFYDKMPHWKGVTNGRHIANCITRTPEVLDWLENACRNLFREVPELGGAYVIAMSENPTHCNFQKHKDRCPYCKDVSDDMFLIKVITAIERGIHSSVPEADVIFSDWTWTTGEDHEKNIAYKRKVISQLPQGVCFATNSEWGKPTNIGGIPTSVNEYSISQVGPSPENAAMLQYAKSRGLRTVAKVQINNSWELSAVPYIPVPYLIQEHLDNLAELKVDGLMLSWTLGGFPGGNLALLRNTPEELAASKFHPELAQKVCEAWKLFSKAFQEFPFHMLSVYWAPMNYGPMVPFYLEPTGYKATMIGYPYDDLEFWRSVYPEDVFENQFHLVSEGWKVGLDLLQKIKGIVQKEEQAEFNELETIALASYCHLRSTYLHVRFVRARNAGDKKVMVEAVREDRGLTLDLYDIVRRDSRIGFEASNHYYYTLNDLREKILNCEYVLAHLEE